jgi:uncharacterized protein YkwD
MEMGMPAKNKKKGKKNKKVSRIPIIIIVVCSVLLLTGGVMYVGRFGLFAKNNQPEQAEVVEEKEPESHITTKQELLDEANKRRAEVGVAALQYDVRLDASAQEKCDDMVTRSYFDHKDPKTGVNNGLAIAKEKMGDNKGTYGENLLGRILPTAESAFDQWFFSKPHREAVLDARYTLTGFGICLENSKEGYYYVVEHFYSPTRFSELSVDK